MTRQFLVPTFIAITAIMLINDPLAAQTTAARIPNPAPAVSTLPAPLPSDLPTTAINMTPLPATSTDPNPTFSDNRVHIHRPGTDVDGYNLNGNIGSGLYVLSGDVHLQSDPKIDQAIAIESQSTDPVTITADEIDVDRDALTYVAKGHVHFVQGTRSGKADTAMLNEGANTLDLIGNADVKDGEHRTLATKMHYNTVDKHFSGTGEVRIYAPLPPPAPKASASPKPKHRLPFQP